MISANQVRFPSCDCFQRLGNGACNAIVRVVLENCPDRATGAVIKEVEYCDFES